MKARSSWSRSGALALLAVSLVATGCILADRLGTPRPDAGGDRRLEAGDEPSPVDAGGDVPSDTPADEVRLPTVIGNWDTWEAVSPLMITHRPVAVAREPISGHRWLFAVGDDLKVYYNELADEVRAGRGWFEVPGGGTTEHPVAAVTYGVGGAPARLQVFRINSLMRRVESNQFGCDAPPCTSGGTWGAWTPITEAGFPHRAVSAAIFAGHLYLYAVGEDDHLVYQTRHDETGWHWFLPVGGLLSDPENHYFGAETLLPVAATDRAGRVVLVMTGMDQRIYMNERADPGWWQYSWSEVGTDATSPVSPSVIHGDLGPAYAHQHALCVYITNADARIEQDCLLDTGRGPGTDYSTGWTDIPAFATTLPSTPAVGGTADAPQWTLYGVRQGDGAVFESTWTGR